MSSRNALAFAVLSASCGGGSARSTAAISELVIETMTGGSTARLVWEVTYDSGGTPTEVEIREDGMRVATVEIVSVNGVIETVEVRSPNSPVVLTRDITFGSNGPVSIVTRNSHSASTSTLLAEYDSAGRPYEITVSELMEYSETDSDTYESYELLDYESEGRLSTVKGSSEADFSAPDGLVWIVEEEWTRSYRYLEDGALRRISTDTTVTDTFQIDPAASADVIVSTSSDEVTYRYNDEGRVEEAESSPYTYEVTYDSEGRIEEIERTSPGSSARARITFSYASQPAVGMVFTPIGLPYGTHFDMMGRFHDVIDLTSIDYLQ